MRFRGLLRSPCFSFRHQFVRKQNTDGYQADGKTTVSLLSKEEKDFIVIDSYSRSGFRLNNGIFVLGPVAILPRTIFQWSVTEHTEITPESLSLFGLLEPKVDIVIIGTGAYQKTLSQEAVDYLRSRKISFEVLSTMTAIATFNFLNSDRRNVAAGLLPPLVTQKSDPFDDAAVSFALKSKRFRNVSVVKSAINQLREEYEDMKEEDKFIEEYKKRLEESRKRKLGPKK